MSDFDLIERAWIPARTLSGEPVLLGLRALLARAHELRGIEDASPLVSAALNRLTLALLYRALRPTKLSQLRALLEAGRFNMNVIDPHLDEHRPRFELFGQKPFFQVGNLKFTEDTSVAKLAVERSSGNNKALFDHSLDGRPPTLSYAEAARLLVAHQAFALSGGRSAGGLAYNSDAPSPRAALIFVTGTNLLETLVGNLIPYKDEEAAAEDLALWEQPEVTLASLLAGQQRPLGPGEFARLYTWPSRTVRLLPTEQGVSRMFYGSGWQAVGTWRDPAVAYEKPQKADADFVSVKFNREKGFWRDFGALVPPDAQDRPRVLSVAEEFSEFLAPNGVLRLTLLGQVVRPGKAVVDAWRSETYPLPLSLLHSDQVRRSLNEATKRAEEVGEAVHSAGYALAQNLADSEIAGKLLQNLPLERTYWATLETLFPNFLTQLAQMTDSDAAYESWTDQVLLTVREAFRVTRRALGHRGQEIKAVVAGEYRLERELKKIGLWDKYKSLRQEAST